MSYFLLVPGLNSTGQSEGALSASLAQPIQTLAQSVHTSYHTVDLTFAHCGPYFGTMAERTADMLETWASPDTTVVASSFGVWFALLHYAEQKYQPAPAWLPFRRLVLVAPYITIQPIASKLPAWKRLGARVTGYKRKGDDNAEEFKIPGRFVHGMLAGKNNLLDGRLANLHGLPITILAAPDAGYHTQEQVDLLKEALQLHPSSIHTLPPNAAALPREEFKKLIFA